MLSLIPKLILPSVHELTPERLQSLGVTVLFMDFDNTLLPYTDDTPPQALLDWLDAVRASGVTLCVLSTTKRGRAPAFCEAHGIACITRARKPFLDGMHRALRRFPPGDGIAALVGDQIYTDVLCANRAGVLSILVTPLHLHNVWLKLRHVLEKPWIAIGRRRQSRANA